MSAFDDVPMIRRLVTIRALPTAIIRNSFAQGFDNP